jgi:hypothetical protein
VAAACILTTRGRLNLSTSLVDDEGVDLVFFARGSTTTLAVEVKARMSDSKPLRIKAQFVASVREATFVPRKWAPYRLSLTELPVVLLRRLSELAQTP